SQQDDPDYGIPVARTRWRVYVPDDLDAQPVSSSSRFNMSTSDDAESLYGNAVLQEAGELLGFMEASISSNRRVQSVNNLKQLGVGSDNLKQLRQELEKLSGSSSGEFSKNKADVLKRIDQVQRQA